MAIEEDQWFDRKSCRLSAKDLADSLVGFANADGGVIVIGVWNGTVEGIDGVRPKVNEWAQAALDFTRPAVRNRQREIECRDDHGGVNHLIVIDVEPSDQVHANHRDEVYLRVGDENRKLNFGLHQELVYDKGQATYETTLVPTASMEDLDQELLGSYAGALQAPDIKRLLRARGLMTKSGSLTAAAVLLFATEPQQWFPEATLRVLRYRGTERKTGSRQQLLDDNLRLGGPLPVQLQEARAHVARRMPARKALTESGRFERVHLIPTDAWLEGVVNAVVHRSYSMHGDHIRVEMFDDRIEVQSPGRFPGVSETDDPLQVTRFARNPRIARVCSDLNFGQELGEGIRRMFEEMRLAGLADPAYERTSGTVRVTLSTHAVDRALEDRLPNDARLFMRIIRNAGRISTGDLAATAHRSRPVAIRVLRALEGEGLIRWHGHSKKDPRAFWTLHNE